ncbi:hypothetical protein JCM8097_001170 [Rhodosporidiobolus ruineniae]
MLGSLKAHARKEAEDEDEHQVERMQTDFSALNASRLVTGVHPTGDCDSWGELETREHYLYHCPAHTHARLDLLSACSTRDLPPLPTLPTPPPPALQPAVLCFINSTNRFPTYHQIVNTGTSGGAAGGRNRGEASAGAAYRAVRTQVLLAKQRLADVDGAVRMDWMRRVTAEEEIRVWMMVQDLVGRLAEYATDDSNRERHLQDARFIADGGSPAGPPASRRA